MRPVAKKSSSKQSTGGDKTLVRFPDGREAWTLDGSIPDGAAAVHETIVDHGEICVLERSGTERARATAAAAIAALPARARRTARGEAYRTSEEWSA